MKSLRQCISGKIIKYKIHVSIKFEYVTFWTFEHKQWNLKINNLSIWIICYLHSCEENWFYHLGIVYWKYLLICNLKQSDEQKVFHWGWRTEYTHYKAAKNINRYHMRPNKKPCTLMLMQMQFKKTITFSSRGKSINVQSRALLFYTSDLKNKCLPLDRTHFLL